MKLKITIELSQQAGEWLFWRVIEQGPQARIETIAAELVEQAVEQAIQQRHLELQQAQQGQASK